ncbi:MAG: GTP 3',8-cyclase MoaA [Chthonomonadales bacterium]|nr:GTP 3',8-cyclase MoaA [Chthonomonadales bacterium]
MQDSYGRVIDYLRVSMTDRCNFRCIYCMPEEGAPIAPRDHLLTGEEIVRLVGIAARLGVRKVRLTGGEPLVRPDLTSIVKRIASLDGIGDLSLTTNGYRLAGKAPELAAAGLTRVNVSVDTLREDRFAAIARRGDLASVLAGVAAARNCGLSPVKLNTVLMRGVNDDEVVDFARLTMEDPFDVRFIELMPIAWSTGVDTQADLRALCGAARTRSANVTVFAHQDEASFAETFRLSDGGTGMLDAAAMRRLFVPAAEARERIERALGPLEPAEVLTNGPARSFRLPRATGTVGFISQMTRDFCERCNRLRLTADGFLRPCLMADGEVDMRTPMRTGATDADLAELILLTVRHKPKEHRIADGVMPTERGMSQIGG